MPVNAPQHKKTFSEKRKYLTKFESFFDEDTSATATKNGSFKGFWMPSEITSLKTITHCEKILLCYIVSFWKSELEFFASNSYIKGNLQISKAKVSNALNKFVKLGYIHKPRTIDFKRRIRGTKSLFTLLAGDPKKRRNDEFF